MKIEQKAGKFSIETWTDGAPMWVVIERDGERIAGLLQLSDLHDLRYCCDRMIVQMEACKR